MTQEVPDLSLQPPGWVSHPRTKHILTAQCVQQVVSLEHAVKKVYFILVLSLHVTAAQWAKEGEEDRKVEFKVTQHSEQKAPVSITQSSRESRLPYRCVCACLVDQSSPALCYPMDCNPPGFSVLGISQARVLEWVAISYSRGSSRPRDGTHISSVSYIGK